MTDEFFKDLDDLILQDVAPPLEEADITTTRVKERVEASGRKCDRHQAKEMILKWVAIGKAEYIGKRRGPSGQKVDAWKLK